MGIDVGNSATPQLVDMDADGALDLVIGCQYATLKYFHNMGTSSAAFFSSTPDIDTLGQILLSQNGAYSGFSVPYIFKHNGKHQMITANMHGDIYFYENIDNNLSGTFDLIDTVVTGELGIRTSGFNLFVSGGDINNDSITDMLVGLSSGGVQVYYGSNSLIGIPENQERELIVCYPNPADQKLHVEVSTSTTNIDIYNLLGEKIAKNHPSDYSNREILIDVSELPEGIYIIVASDHKNIRRSKVVIQH
jgi:hypothetical protein